MAKVVKGNARKYDLFTRIDGFIKNSNSNVCIYSIGNFSCGEMIAVKKGLGNVKVSVMPNKISKIVLKKYFADYDSKIKGKVCLAFADDIFAAAAVSKSVKKSLRDRLQLSGVSWSGQMNSDSDFLKQVCEFRSKKGFLSAVVGKVAEPVLKFKALLKIHGESA